MKFIYDKQSGKVIPKPEPPNLIIEMFDVPAEQIAFVELVESMARIRKELQSMTVAKEGPRPPANHPDRF